MTETVPDKLWRRLSDVTPARIGLGRAGNALPTKPMLDFQLAHARARDAVHMALDTELLSERLGEFKPVLVASQAANRRIFLQQPDLGRRLAPESRTKLHRGEFDAAFVLADGLSATAVHRHGAALYWKIHERLTGWRIAPIILANQSRVALGDDIGLALGAAQVIMLIGERPGLSSPDSLSAYLTWDPKPGRLDSERNCISNIRQPDGLAYDSAADLLVWLMRAARQRQLSGISLKNDHYNSRSIPLHPP